MWSYNYVILSCKSKEIGQTIIPIVEPVRGSICLSPLFTRIWFFFWWHVLFSPDAKVTLYWTSAHGATVQFTKTRCTYACVTTWHQRPRKWEILTNYAKFFAYWIPKGAFAISWCWSDQSISCVTVTVARLSKGQWWSNSRWNSRLVITRWVSICHVQLLQNKKEIRKNRFLEFVMRYSLILIYFYVSFIFKTKIL